MKNLTLKFLLISFYLSLIFSQNLTNSANNSTNSTSLPNSSNTPIYVPLPDFSGATNSTTVLDQVWYSGYVLYNYFMNYLMNNCTDSRLNDPNGSFNISQTDTPDIYQEMCIVLTMDLGQILSNYSCNPWVCNFQGTCQFTLTNDSIINQTCNCNSGWYGASCMFPTADYTYGLALLNGIVQYATHLNKTSPISDEYTFINVLQMAQLYLSFAGYASPSDLPMINQGCLTIFSILSSSQVNITSATSNFIGSFLQEVLSDPNLPSSFDPSQLLTNFGSQNNTSTSTYGYSSNSVDTNSDMTLSVSGSRRYLLRFLTSAKNATLNNTVTTKTINMANPTVTVPRNVTSLLPKGSSLTFSFVRDPKTYNNPNSPYIISQVVTIQAKNGTNLINYPATATPISLTIPWAFVPLTCANYQSNCTVYKMNNTKWTNSSNCILDPSKTNGNSSLINCTSFGTFGLSCQCSVNTKLLVASAGVNSSKTNKTSNSSLYGFSMILSLILAVLFI